jgi:hypothetical protein
MATDGPAANPEPSGPLRRAWADALWLAALAGWSAAWCLSAAPRVGVTFDEPFYLGAGWAHATAAANGVMPLPLDALPLPLRLHELRTGETLDADGRLALLNRARAVTLGWLWLLIFSAWRLGRAAGGSWAGRVAAGLIAADPNFLAHAALATTDIAASAALVAFARAVYAGRDGGWWRRVVLPGLWFGVAALCKLSGLLYGGVLLVALEVCHRFASGALSQPREGGAGTWGWKVAKVVARSVLAVAAVVAVGAAVALLYCGFPEERGNPFAVQAFAFQWWHNGERWPTFLNGTYYPEGYRLYFPELLLMKLPLPVFLLAGVALVRPRAAANPLALAALLMLAALLTANIQIGVRLALPAVAVGYAALAVGLSRGYPRCVPWFGLSAVAVMAATSAWVWPHGLCYLNQPSGGLEAAPRRVCDSNLDWGQGMPDLAAWHEASGRPPTVVWYFGNDPAANRPPFQRIVVEGLPIAGERDLKEQVGRRVLAVGHTVVALHQDAPPSKVAALAYLRTRRPLARTPTFVLYDFRDGEPPALD